MSGSEALASITRAVKDEQERTRKLDGQLSAANQDLLKLDRQRNQLLQELAKVRIDYLNAADVVARLDAADRQVLALMRDRAEATGALQGELDEIESHRADLEQRRADLQDRLEGAAKAIDDAEVEAQRRLAEDE